MKCFIYCEWIDDTRLRKSLPNVIFIDKVVLMGFRLIFTSFHEERETIVKGGGCHLIKDPNSSVPGLLYEFSDAEIEIAERLSRVKEGRYTPKVFKVIDSKKNAHEATAYIIKHPLGSSEASEEYRAHMITGAKKHEFPSNYIHHIETI